MRLKSARMSSRVAGASAADCPRSRTARPSKRINETQALPTTPAEEVCEGGRKFVIASPQFSRKPYEGYSNGCHQPIPHHSLLALRQPLRMRKPKGSQQTNTNPEAPIKMASAVRPRPLRKINRHKAKSAGAQIAPNVRPISPRTGNGQSLGPPKSSPQCSHYLNLNLHNSALPDLGIGHSSPILVRSAATGCTWQCGRCARRSPS